MLPSPYIHYWGTTQGLKVWIVDGRAVRDTYDLDFSQGGNGCRYAFIPQDEIWIDNGVQPVEMPAVLVHETYERSLMLQGWDYERAHAAATEVERRYRQRPTMEALLSRKLGEVYFVWSRETGLLTMDGSKALLTLLRVSVKGEPREWGIEDDEEYDEEGSDEDTYRVTMTTVEDHVPILLDWLLRRAGHKRGDVLGYTEGGGLLCDVDQQEIISQRGCFYPPDAVEAEWGIEFYGMWERWDRGAKLKVHHAVEAIEQRFPEMQGAPVRGTGGELLFELVGESIGSLDRAMLIEAPPPSETQTQQTYYHGCSSARRANEIARFGIRPDQLPSRHWSPRVEPMQGRVYLTPDFGVAVEYALTSGHDPRIPDDYPPDGYIFEVPGSALQDVEPDEDRVGSLLWGDDTPDWLHDIAAAVDPGSPHMADPREILRRMTPEQKQEVMRERPLTVAHLGPVVPTRVWRLRHPGEGHYWDQSGWKAYPLSSLLSEALQESPPPSQEQAEKMYYHGCPTTRKARAIARSGIQPDRSYSQPWDKMGGPAACPTRGRVYLTPDFGVAADYASNSDERYGYVFGVSGSALMDVEPDDSEVSYILSWDGQYGQTCPDWLWQMAEQDNPENPLAANTKCLLTLMTPEQKQELIALSPIVIAHHGVLRPDRMWRKDLIQGPEQNLYPQDGWERVPMSSLLVGRAEESLAEDTVAHQQHRGSYYYRYHPKGDMRALLRQGLYTAHPGDMPGSFVDIPREENRWADQDPDEEGTYRFYVTTEANWLDDASLARSRVAVRIPAHFLDDRLQQCGAFPNDRYVDTGDYEERVLEPSQYDILIGGRWQRADTVPEDMLDYWTHQYYEKPGYYGAKLNDEEYDVGVEESIGSLAHLVESLMEAPTPDEPMRATAYYHGCPTQAAADAIVREGLKPLGGSRERGWQQARREAVYLTPSFGEAVSYANHPGIPVEEEPWGYVFEVPGSALTDVDPDEDDVGGLLLWIEMVQERPEHYAELVRVHPDMGYTPAETLKSLDWLLDFAKRHVTPRVLRLALGGDYPAVPMAGKQILRALTRYDRAELLRVLKGKPLASLASATPTRVWRVRRTGSWHPDKQPGRAGIQEIALDSVTPAGEAPVIEDAMSADAHTVGELDLLVESLVPALIYQKARRWAQELNGKIPVGVDYTVTLREVIGQRTIDIIIQDLEASGLPTPKDPKVLDKFRWDLFGMRVHIKTHGGGLTYTPGADSGAGSGGMYSPGEGAIYLWVSDRRFVEEFAGIMTHETYHAIEDKARTDLGDWPTTYAGSRNAGYYFSWPGEQRAYATELAAEYWELVREKGPEARWEDTRKYRVLYQSVEGDPEAKALVDQIMELAKQEFQRLSTAGPAAYDPSRARPEPRGVPAEATVGGLDRMLSEAKRPVSWKREVAKATERGSTIYPNFDPYEDQDPADQAAELYFQIGHDQGGEDEDEESLIHTIWMWTGPGGLVINVRDHEGINLPGSHDIEFGPGVAGKLYKGRYDARTGWVSVVPPEAQRYRPIPEALLRDLKDAFNPKKIVTFEARTIGALDAALNEETHDYGCLQADLIGGAKEGILAQGMRVKDEDLMGDGRETEAHITIKYGLHTSDPEEVKKPLKGEERVTIKFGKLSSFPPSESSDNAAVLKYDIESAGLDRLNKLVSDNLKCTDTHPEYHAHATVAYLKPEAITRYVGDGSLTGKEFTIGTVTFSGKDGKKTEIKLGEQWQDLSYFQGRSMPGYSAIERTDRDFLTHWQDRQRADWKAQYELAVQFLMGKGRFVVDARTVGSLDMALSEGAYRIPSYSLATHYYLMAIKEQDEVEEWKRLGYPKDAEECERKAAKLLALAKRHAKRAGLPDDFYMDFPRIAPAAGIPFQPGWTAEALTEATDPRLATDTPEFRAWFKQSKVVDDVGQLDRVVCEVIGDDWPDELRQYLPDLLDAFPRRDYDSDEAWEASLYDAALRDSEQDEEDAAKKQEAEETYQAALAYRDALLLAADEVIQRCESVGLIHLGGQDNCHDFADSWYLQFELFDGEDGLEIRLSNHRQPAGGGAKLNQETGQFERPYGESDVDIRVIAGQAVDWTPLEDRLRELRIKASSVVESLSEAYASIEDVAENGTWIWGDGEIETGYFHAKAAYDKYAPAVPDDDRDDAAGIRLGIEHGGILVNLEDLTLFVRCAPPMAGLTSNAAYLTLLNLLAHTSAHFTVELTTEVGVESEVPGETMTVWEMKNLVRQWIQIAGQVQEESVQEARLSPYEIGPYGAWVWSDGSFDHGTNAWGGGLHHVARAERKYGKDGFQAALDAGSIRIRPGDDGSGFKVQIGSSKAPFAVAALQTLRELVAGQSPDDCPEVEFEWWDSNITHHHRYLSQEDAVDYLDRCVNAGALIEALTPHGTYYANTAGRHFWGDQGAGILPLCTSTGRFLLAYRSSEVNEPHTWGIWGGRIEDEAPETAARREFIEETGYTGSMELVPSYVYTTEGFQYSNFLGIVPEEFEPGHGWETEGHRWVTWEEMYRVKPQHFGLAALLKNAHEQIQKLVERDESGIQEQVGIDHPDLAPFPFEQVTAKTPDGKTFRVILKNPQERSGFLVGDEVDVEGEEVRRRVLVGKDKGKLADVTTQMIQLGAITSREPLRALKHTGKLVNARRYIDQHPVAEVVVENGYDQIQKLVEQGEQVTESLLEAAVPPLGQPVDDYEGKAPEHDWDATDNYGKWTQQTVAQFVGVKPDRFVYTAMVDLADLKPQRVEKQGAEALRKGEGELDPVFMEQAEEMLERWTAGETQYHRSGFDNWRDFLPWDPDDGYDDSDVELLARELQARSEVESYPEDELQRSFGRGFPPIVVTREVDGSVVINDGNHRADIWREQDYDVAPAWVNDDMARQASKRRPPTVRRAGVVKRVVDQGQQVAESFQPSTYSLAPELTDEEREEMVAAVLHDSVDEINNYADLAREDLGDDATDVEVDARAEKMVREEIERALDDALEGIAGMSDPLVLYRAIDVDPVDPATVWQHIRTRGIGVYWADEEDKAECHWGHGGPCVVLRASVPSKSVDWKGTLFARCQPSLGEEEQEIRLLKGRSVHVTGIQLPSGEWQPVNIRARA